MRSTSKENLFQFQGESISERQEVKGARVRCNVGWCDKESLHESEAELATQARAWEVQPGA